jgi:hypothetical protein
MSGRGDESKPQFAVLAVRDRRSIFGSAEALLKVAGKVKNYPTFESASAAAAERTAEESAEHVSYRVVQIDEGKDGKP